MGVLPLQFADGDTIESLGLRGDEVFDVNGVAAAVEAAARSEPARVEVWAGDDRRFTARLRIDTPQDAAYYHHGGILPYVLRRLLGNA